MRIRLIAVGKVRERYIAAAVDDFRKRLRPYATLDEVEVAAAHGGDPGRAIADESERILRLVEPAEPFWLLDRTGTQIDSLELARRIDGLAAAGTHRITLAVAGTYGASEALRARASFLWSLSELTLLHEWARALVYEQLYRAAKIARNEPYHH